MSKRENLRLKLADAVERVLGLSHELTLPNCLRYVKPHLSSFCIGDDVTISLEDWETAIELATLRLAKPIDQPTPLLKCRPLVMSSSDWQEHLLGRLDKLVSEGVIPKKEYDYKKRLVQESVSREQYSDRLRQIAIESGT